MIEDVKTLTRKGIKHLQTTAKPLLMCYFCTPLTNYSPLLNRPH